MLYKEQNRVYHQQNPSRVARILDKIKTRRFRFRLEPGQGGLSTAAFAVSAFWPGWTERVFNLALHNVDGSFERLFVGIPAEGPHHGVDGSHPDGFASLDSTEGLPPAFRRRNTRRHRR